MPQFTIRVYGLLVNDTNQILVSDEHIRGNLYTKFPGGGLEFGEGTRDCLVREFMEEMNLRVAIKEHFYTTDFFQLSAFNPGHQIVSIYYLVEALEPIAVPLRSKPFDFDEAQQLQYAQTGETETFRWVDYTDFSAETVSLPIDKIVAAKLKTEWLPTRLDQ